MPVKKSNTLDSISVRFAVFNDRRRTRRWKFQTKRTMTLLLGAALSVGGVTEAFDDVHFVVKKDLDRVSVVKRDGAGHEKIVAAMKPSFAANSVFKIAQAVPSRLVTREADLFDESLFSIGATSVKSRSIAEKFSIFNDTIREQFFKTELPYGKLIHEKAAKYDVDPALVAAVMEQESRFKPRATSQVGAKGLMQLMPRTGRWMGARNLYDPEENVDAGTKYLKYLEKRFEGNLKNTVAAYNAGEGNVRRYKGVPPYRETRTYVKNVLHNYEKRTRQLQKYSEQYSDGTAIPSVVGAAE